MLFKYHVLKHTYSIYYNMKPPEVNKCHWHTFFLNCEVTPWATSPLNWVIVNVGLVDWTTALC